MNTVLIEIVNPNALRLLYHLEELNLIKILKENIGENAEPPLDDKSATPDDPSQI
jgi:hypothetical protein